MLHFTLWSWMKSVVGKAAVAEGCTWALRLADWIVLSNYSLAQSWVLSHNTVSSCPSTKGTYTSLDFLVLCCFPWLETTWLLIYGITPEGSLCPLTLLDTAPFVCCFSDSMSDTIPFKKISPVVATISCKKWPGEKVLPLWITAQRSSSVQRGSGRGIWEEQQTWGTLHPNPLTRRTSISL